MKLRLQVNIAAVFSIVAAVASGLAACADDDDMNHDKDASARVVTGEFARSDFSDSDFGKRKFIDFVQKDWRSEIKSHDSSDLTEFESRKVDTEEKELAENRQRADGRREQERDETMRERLAPIKMIGDWVPSKLDPVNSGGFGTCDDNGSPVPYRLNGHVDIERGDPWDLHN